MGGVPNFGLGSGGATTGGEDEGGRGGKGGGGVVEKRDHLKAQSQGKRITRRGKGPRANGGKLEGKKVVVTGVGRVHV